jgi:hypothetical protein
MMGDKRRSFQAEISIKYCNGKARQTEEMFGWNRNSVKQGLHERRTGIICLGAQKGCCGNKLWEEKYPEVAEALWKVAELHSQQDPTFRTPIAFTRLTAAEALNQLKKQGFSDDVLPSPRAMADVLNRNGYRLRPVVKAKPQKKFQKQTPFSQISETKMGKVSLRVRLNG